MWLDGDGRQSSFGTQILHPFVDVEVAYNASGVWHKALFQLDTGLSRTSVLPSIVKEIGSPKNGTVRLSGAAGWQDFSCHICLIRFPGCPREAIGVNAVTLDHPLANTGAGGLLGMDALAQGTLHLAGGAGPSFFEIPVA